MAGVPALSRLILLLLSLQLVVADYLDAGGSWFEEPHSWFEEPHPALGSRDLTAQPAAKANPLRILCLGASITYGMRSPGGNGYRYGLRGKLVEQGHDVNMIGSVRAGNMSNNHVEGWIGYRIHQIAEKAKLSLPKMPNVVLICAGTNDMSQGFELSTAHERIAALIDHALAVVPGTAVIVATLPPNVNPTTEARILPFNANLQTVVSERASKGKKVSLVDMHSDWFSVADIGPDGTHPTELGYLKMARVFYTGIVAAVQAGNVSAPLAVKGVDDYSAGNDSSVAGAAMNVVCQSGNGRTVTSVQRQQCSMSSRIRAYSTYLALGSLLSGYISGSVF